ncbi:lanthionine synthetase C family protein [Streptomyces caatingaensis]|uniref:Lanthionine synthetase n=1 Tax=Streptomyces caatingaensis TaxID=1678637 RepID=A0A0K9XEF5_9ACTN|nr:lanthionine synthetase C family protein [Streptomyces caatingaensis]KNB51755.1 hypothetical protein AC230_15645 [Streptomyces caatingaensis]
MRAEARKVAARVLDRLADPEAAEADTGFPDGPAGEPVWHDLSLASGHPGVSLAFSGSTDRRPENVARAHAYLIRALAAVAAGGNPPAGLYGSTSAAAHALLIAYRATGGYTSALAQLDAYHRDLIREALPQVPSDGPVENNREYDVISGMTGIGRHLLARGEPLLPELRAVLAYLVHMSKDDVPLRGHRVPRWWTWAAPRKGQEAALPDGHLNLSLSHGVCGPLALLSLSWQAGVHVPGHREAIESLMSLLETWAVPDGQGIRWPQILTLADWSAGTVAVPWHRPSWCYGTPGMTRAVHLAAIALDRTDWHDLAHRSLLPLLSRPVAEWGVTDAELCHGASGLLHLFGLLAPHIDDPRVPAARDDLAAMTLSMFDASHRFGYRTAATNAPLGADLPAFLDGAAGVALALDAYANDGVAGAGWDMTLLAN